MNTVPYSDTKNSLKAAVKYESKRTHKQIVLEHIARQGHHGSTDEETMNATRLKESTSRARRVGLTKEGLVRDSGKSRDTTGGNPATVWVAVMKQGKLFE